MALPLRTPSHSPAPSHARRPTPTPALPPRTLTRGAPQLRFLLIQNRMGKTRVAKWYIQLTEEEKQELIAEAHAVVSVRGSRQTNFVEFRTFKIVYKRYQGLYFIMCVDVNDNNMAYLEAIHNFVEVRTRRPRVPRPLSPSPPQRPRPSCTRVRVCL